MKKCQKFYCISIFLSLFTGITFSQTSNEYIVKGKISGASNGWIYLLHSDTYKKDVKKDSTKIENGNFTFTGTVNGVEQIIIGLPMTDSKGNIMPTSFSWKGPFMLAVGTLNIEGALNSLSANFKAFGTPVQNEYNLYLKSRAELNNPKNKVNPNKNYSMLMNKNVEIVESHIKKFPNSEVSAYIVKKALLTANHSTLTRVFSYLSPNIQNSKYGEEIKKLIVSSEKIAIGQNAPLFTLPDINGNFISLNSSKGKYTLIDFWASWCGPCRVENPNLIKAYSAFKNKGFTILSISMDKNKKDWLKAIKEDKLPWLQLSDLKATQSEVGINYNIKSIPMNFLIDKEGKIIARDLRGIELINQLQKLLP